MGMSSEIDLTQEQYDTVLDLLKKQLPDTTVWAYGSQVKWISHPNSDLDLAVFASPEQSQQVSDLREAFEESNLPFRVDLFVWDTIPDSFRSQIKANHTVIVEENTSSLTSLYEPHFPNTWRRHDLYSLADWINGLAFKKINFSNHGKPVIKIAELKNGITKQTRLTEDTFEDSVKIKYGDMLFAWSGQPEKSIGIF